MAELKELTDLSSAVEPPLLAALRNRDLHHNDERSIITDITYPLTERLGKQQSEMKLMTETLEKQRSEMRLLQQMLEQQQSAGDTLVNRIDKLEITQRRESDSLFTMLDAARDLLPTIQTRFGDFADQIILNCRNYDKRSNLHLSGIIPYDGYVEYEVKGYGEKLHFYVVGNQAAQLFVEIVKDGRIVKQESLMALNDGPNQIEVGTMAGKCFVRFRTSNNTGIVRVLEFTNHKFVIFRHKYLAAYID